MIGADISDDDGYELWENSTFGKDPTVPAFAVTPGPRGESRQERYLGPYRLLEHIGGGGMGVIYRAEDTRLQRIVALKLLPPDLTRDPIAKARFLQEARTASALDHPNICSIHEVGETADHQLYLVMPCYDGETLRQRIERGPLPIAEALEIASQVAQGLAKAHRNGIVHRDIKPGNLMITADGLVKILDFGIAKLIGGAGITREGSMVGTPAYMSPEQMNGDDVDVRTDLWSLGIVLYEMVTGQRPFRGHESVLRDSIFHAAPEPLAQRRPDAPAELQRLVSSLLAKDPAARATPADEVARTLRRLAGVETNSRAVLQWPIAGVSRKWRLPASALLLLVALAGLLASARQESAPVAAIQSPRSMAGETVPAAARSERRLSLLVLGFQDLTGEAPARGWLDPALTEMMTTEMAAGGTARVVSSEHAAQVRKALALSSVENPDRVTLDRLHSLVGTDLAIFGAYLPLKGRGEDAFRLDVRVVALPEGHTIASVTEDGYESRLPDLVERAGERLRRALGLSLLTDQQAREARLLLPSGSGAIRLYTEALVHLRSYDLAEARDLLLDAERLDPESVAVQAALTETWKLLGQDARAREAAAKAFRFREPLSPEAKLALEAQLYAIEKQWARASEIYRSLWTFFPDDTNYGIQLATSLMMEGRGREAVSVLAELRTLPPPEGEDPRIDLLEARAARRMSDFAAEERAAVVAVAKARQFGAPLIVAQALIYQGDAMLMSGRTREALSIFRQAESIALQEGDRWTTGMAVSNIANALYELGRWRESAAMHEKSLAMARELDNAIGVSAQLYTLGQLYREQGDLERAHHLLEQSHDWYLRMGDSMMQARVEELIASICLAQGDLEKAEILFVHAVKNSRQAASRMDEAQALHGLSKLRRFQGQLEEARRLQEEALQILRDLVQPALATAILSSSVDLLTRTGDLQMAQRRLEMAVAAGRKVDNAVVSGSILELRTRLALPTGDLAVSLNAGKAQLELARVIDSRPLKVIALRNFARAARAAGDSESAIRSFRESLDLAIEMGDHLSATAARAELARLELEQGESKSAEQLARQAADWCRARRIVGGEAAATAVLAESLLRLGRQEEAFATAQRARALLPQDDRELFLTMVPILARIDAAAGAPGTLQRLRKAIAEADEAGFVVAALEARLTLGQLLLARGDGAGRPILQAVQKEAGARGLGLIARRATEAISPSSPSTPPLPPRRAGSPAARAGI